MEHPHFSIIIYSIFQVYTVIYGIPPVCRSCIKKKHIVKLMRGIHFYCGRLWWRLIMTLLQWAFRRSLYWYCFFASGVCACSRSILVFHGRDMTWYRSQLPGCWLQLLVAAVAKFTAIHEENLWETGPRSWFQQLISYGFMVVSRMCQQQSLLANLAMFFLASKIVGFHHLGIENRSQHFPPWVSNHVPRRCTNFGRLC